MSHLNYNRKLPGGFLSAELVDAVIKARAQYARVQALMDSVVGNPADYSKLEDNVNFGIPATFGPNFYTGVGLIGTGLNSIAASVLSDLDLGG